MFSLSLQTEEDIRSQLVSPTLIQNLNSWEFVRWTRSQAEFSVRRRRVYGTIDILIAESCKHIKAKRFCFENWNVNCLENRAAHLWGMANSLLCQRYLQLSFFTWRLQTKWNVTRQTSYELRWCMYTSNEERKITCVTTGWVTKSETVVLNFKWNIFLIILHSWDC